MAEIRCPVCQRENSIESEFCQFCGARLRMPASATTIRPGEEPVKKPTSEFERVTPSIKSARPLKAGEEPTKKDTAELEPVLPSWLRAARGGASKETTLSPLSSGEAPTKPEEKSAAMPLGSKEQGEELPDWLAGLQASEEEEEIPEWLASLQQKSVIPADSAPPPFTSAAPSSPLHPEKPLRTAEAEPLAEGPAEGGLTREANIPRAVPESPETEIPDWLANLPSPPPEISPTAEAEAASLQGEPIPVDEALPDWLKSLQPEEQAPIPAAPTAKEALSAEEPDWLKALQPEDQAPIPAAPTAKEALSAEEPDWLKALQVEGEEAVQPTENWAEPALPELTPEWLMGVKPSKAPSEEKAPPIIAEEGEGGTAFSMEMPDWLATLKPEESVIFSTPSTGTAEEEMIAPATLPAWVQAMRPVEAAIEESTSTFLDEATVETSGLLAGLRGVLPAGDIVPTRKPSSPAVKLQVNESQQNLAGQLEEMILGEEVRHSQVWTKKETLPRLLRWLVAMILLLATLLPLIGGWAGSAVLSPPGLASLIQQMDSLPANGPVLVAFEYEPALASELEAAAIPFINDFVLTKASRLTLLSTSPTGSMLAERFSQNILANQQYQEGAQYINLGYLPGGASGILAFAANPHSMGTAEAWQSPALANIASLHDYTALVVVTDNADIARAWIEQARPYLGNRPMVVVISVQAEPLIQPYYDSGQIQGLVTGLAGGLAYAQAKPDLDPGPGIQYWGAFGTGLLTAALLIFLGGFWSVIQTRSKRRQDLNQGAK